MYFKANLNRSVLKPSPPQNEKELFARAQALAGLKIKDIAQTYQLSLPQDLKRQKGIVGQVLEHCLGAYAHNLSMPDFPHLGIELKTLPVNDKGRCLESTFLCTAPIPWQNELWSQSRVYIKSKKILWIPILVPQNRALSERIIAHPLLWTMEKNIEAQLKRDWEELTEFLALGQFEQLRAHFGKYLHVRPKAPNSKTFIKVLNDQGQWIHTVPKGFYFRKVFTQSILESHFVVL